jgi:hypothetical protein
MSAQPIVQETRRLAGKASLTNSFQAMLVLPLG